VAVANARPEPDFRYRLEREGRVLIPELKCHDKIPRPVSRRVSIHSRVVVFQPTANVSRHSDVVAALITFAPKHIHESLLWN
jgi:hypothetical protein